MIKKFVNPLLWVDMEMTGLNIKTDKILEFACILTDGNLQSTVEGPQFIIQTEKQLLDSMDEWCQKTHGNSGLIQSCLNSVHTIKDCENAVLNFLKENGIKDREAIIAGNSVGIDKSFIDINMPNLSAYLHYRIVDVSTVKELCKRWNPQTLRNAPLKSGKHRAIDDIRESIKELEYYKSKFFNLSQ